MGETQMDGVNWLLPLQGKGEGQMFSWKLIQPRAGHREYSAPAINPCPPAPDPPSQPQHQQKACLPSRGVHMCTERGPSGRTPLGPLDQTGALGLL